MAELKPLTGKVNWYDPRNAYGVILSDDRLHYFFHASSLTGDVNTISKGMDVIFKARPRSHRKKGMEAYDISIKNVTPGTNMERVLVPDDSEQRPKFPPPSTPTQVDRPKTPVRWRKGYIRDRIKGERYEGRAKYLAKLKVGEEVILSREPENPHDPYAIKVETKDGHMLGYLDWQLARRMASSFEEHPGTIQATVIGLTGGFESSGTYPGALIEFKAPGSISQESEKAESIPAAPIMIRIAGCYESIDLMTIPAGRYTLIDPEGRLLADKQWEPASLGLSIIWKSYIKAGYGLVLDK
jgi:cold shock CspA family protein